MHVVDKSPIVFGVGVGTCEVTRCQTVRILRINFQFDKEFFSKELPKLWAFLLLI